MYRVRTVRVVVRGEAEYDHEEGVRSVHRTDLCFSICRFSQVVSIPRVQPHAQSLFLFPIVFGINLRASCNAHKIQNSTHCRRRTLLVTSTRARWSLLYLYHCAAVSMKINREVRHGVSTVVDWHCLVGLKRLSIFAYRLTVNTNDRFIGLTSI